MRKQVWIQRTLLFFLVLFWVNAQAATITVDSPDGMTLAPATTGSCALRGAIASINAGADRHGCVSSGGAYGADDLIKFSPLLKNQTITLRTEWDYGEKVDEVYGENAFLPIVTATPRLTIDALDTDGTPLGITLDGVRDPSEDCQNDGYCVGRSILAIYEKEDSIPTVTVRGLTFKNGISYEGGGAIRSEYYPEDESDLVSLIIEQCVFEDNLTPGSVDYSDGGAIRVYMAHVVVNDSVFRNNRAMRQGGAISLDGGWVGDRTASLVINNSVFSGNNDKIGDYSSSYAGGGALYANGASVIINDSEFIDNKSVGNSNYCDGGAVCVVSGSLMVTGSTFRGNTYFADHYGDSAGGAIGYYYYDDDEEGRGEFIVRDSVFENNSGSYGAIYITGETNIVAVISGSVFTGNRAVMEQRYVVDHDENGNPIYGETYYRYGGGGAISSYGERSLKISSSVFSGNQAGAGGAIYLGESYGENLLAIDASVFVGNEVIACDEEDGYCESVSYYSDEGGYGGAVYTAGHSARISNTTLTDNTAALAGGAISIGVGGYGGSLDARHLTLVNNTAGSGAAIYVGDAATVVVHNSLLASGGGAELCAIDESGDMSGDISGKYNIEYRSGSNTTSCHSANQVNITGGTALNQIVATTPADNGGPTSTLALPAGSPAIGAADKTVGGTSQMLDENGSWVDATKDQRGFSRAAVTAGRSIGAFEYGAASSQLALNGDPQDGQVSVSYSDVSIVASGGASPYSYAVTVGALPPGLAINAVTGAISGTPTTAGSYTFTFTVTDSDTTTVSAEFSIVIAAAPPPPLELDGDPQDGQVSVSYSDISIVASGGTSPYSYAVTVGALPTGLSLDPDTGAISGTPTTAGSYTFTVTVTDNDTTTASAEF
ncbi:MAG: putative Ig domain-containing protein, partial [Burkholderiales bacterium]|nr:putative Ig domain-containing protein [Burkholderiales bacterium]